jgi:hypothetical protein
LERLAFCQAAVVCANSWATPAPDFGLPKGVAVFEHTAECAAASLQVPHDELPKDRGGNQQTRGRHMRGMAVSNVSNSPTTQPKTQLSCSSGPAVAPAESVTP